MACPEIHRKKFFKLKNVEALPQDAFGVYGIWYGKHCIYIGKAKLQPISKRLACHWRESHNSYLNEWIEAKGSSLLFTYKILQSENIDVFERFYIRKFKPLENIIKY